MCILEMHSWTDFAYTFLFYCILIKNKCSQIIMDAMTWVLTLWACMENDMRLEVKRRRRGECSSSSALFVEMLKVRGNYSVTSVCVGDTDSIIVITHTHAGSFQPVHSYQGILFTASILWVTSRTHRLWCVCVCVRKRQKEIWIHFNTLMCLKSHVSANVHTAILKSIMIL